MNSEERGTIVILIIKLFPLRIEETFSLRSVYNVD
jgi:hypothetical protein